MNRRSFFQSVLGFIGGVAVAFAKTEKKPEQFGDKTIPPAEETEKESIVWDEGVPFPDTTTSYCGAFFIDSSNWPIKIYVFNSNEWVEIPEAKVSIDE